MKLMVLLLIPFSFASAASAGDLDSFPYTAACKEFHLNTPKRPPQPDDDAAWGVATREPYKKKGMKLHKLGRWTQSNCLLIHALNISADHALILIETIGFNYAALGDDRRALKYFEDATGFSWDLDSWLQHKSKPPFDKILNKAVYREYEESLYGYYKQNGLPSPGH